MARSPNAESGADSKKPRIGVVSAFFMIAIALLCDLVQVGLGFMAAIPSIGIVFVPFSWLMSTAVFFTFFIWFRLAGVNYLDRNTSVRLLTVILAFAVEWIPIINLIPAITFGVSAVIFTSRYADGKSGLFVKAKRKYLESDQEERDTRLLAAQARFNRDQESLEATRVRERGGPDAIAGSDFGATESELKKRRFEREKLRNPSIEAPLHDPEEEAMLLDLRKKEEGRKDWF